MDRTNKQIAGFTLVEVLVVIAMAALLLLAGSYSFVSWQQNMAGQQIGNQVFSALRLARAQAISSGVITSVCAATDSTLSSCNTGASNWNNGWLVFQDPNNNGSYSTANLVQVFPLNVSNPNTSVDTSGTLSRYATFNTLGFATRQVHITAKPTGCSGSNGSDVYLKASGRITATTISCP